MFMLLGGNKKFDLDLGGYTGTNSLILFPAGKIKLGRSAGRENGFISGFIWKRPGSWDILRFRSFVINPPIQHFTWLIFLLFCTFYTLNINTCFIELVSLMCTICLLLYARSFREKIHAFSSQVFILTRVFKINFVFKTSRAYSRIIIFFNLTLL